LVQFVAEYFIPELVMLSVEKPVSGVVQLLSRLRRQGAIGENGVRP
jgi:hypothetical protein